MISLNTDISKKQPLYMQIYSQIKSDIRLGKLKSGQKIYSRRALSSFLGVSLNTVDTAYAQLLSEGFIEAVAKKGYFVAEIDALIPDLNLQAGFLSSEIENKSDLKLIADFSTSGVDKEFFPYNTWRRLLKNRFNEYDKTILDCTSPEGEKELRKAVSDYLYINRGVDSMEGKRLIIGAGTDNLLQILSYILDNSCQIAMENPVYHEAYLFFKRMGHNVKTIDVDKGGIQVEALKGMDNTAVYITPSHQFPLGITMPISRRIKLLNWASGGKNRYIIEDDYDSEFRYDIKPVASVKSIDTSERVIYLGSFSKSVAPSVRISYMVLPHELLKVYKEGYTQFNSAVSKLEQLTLADFILNGHYETHLNKMRKIYGHKRKFFLSCLNECFGDKINILGENAGHHLLLRLNNDMEEKDLIKSAFNYGVKVYPVSKYFTSGVFKEYENTVLLGYAALNENQIKEGVLALKSAWA